MDRRVWIALALVVIIAVLYFAVSSESAPEDRTVEFAAISGLERVEVMPPAGDEGPEMIVLERGDDGQWWIVRPVEALADWRKTQRLEQVFSDLLKTDDIVIDAERADDYDLDEQRAVRLALFGAGDERPALELLVGREFEVVQTGARRTFVRRPGEDQIYRAHAAFGELVRLGVDEWRDAAIVSVGDEGIEQVVIRHRDGHEVGIERRDRDWRLVEGPAADVGLDGQKATRIAATIGRLKAVGFTERTPEELGLDTPDAVVEITTGTDDIRLDIVRRESEEEDEQDRFFARRDESDTAVELSDDVGPLLLSRLIDVRARSLIPVGSSQITEIALAGDEPVHLERRDGEWAMLQPEGREFDAQKVQRLAEFVAGLRVERWISDLTAADVGLEDGDWREVAIGVDGEQTVLTLGDPVPRTRAARYGKYSEIDGIFILSGSAVERLLSTAEALEAE